MKEVDERVERLRKARGADITALTDKFFNALNRYSEDMKCYGGKMTDEFLEFINELEILVENIKKAQTQEELDTKIQDMYDYLDKNKSLLDKEYVRLAIRGRFRRFILDNYYIIIGGEPIKNDSSRANYSKDDEPDKIADHIAQRIRWSFFEAEYDETTGYNVEEKRVNGQKESMQGECNEATFRVLELCKVMGYTAKGYKTEAILGKNMDKCDSHAFAIIDIKGKKYIIDCTYRQFFLVSMKYNLRAMFREQDDRRDTSVGTRMLQSEETKRIAEHILTYGWIEATPENLKAYLDGFVKEGEYLADEYLQMIIDAKPIEERKSSKVKGEKHKDFSTEFIMESAPEIQEFDFEEFSDTWTEEEQIDRIVQRERRRLSQNIGAEGEPYDLEKDSLAGDCSRSSLRVSADCRLKNIEATRIYTREVVYVNGKDIIELNLYLGHYFCLVNINEKQYLVDCTYRQFFRESQIFYRRPKDSQKNALHRPGMYMIQDDGRRAVAEQILKKGWIEATPENIKAYMDGFLMAHLKSSEPINISGEEYLRILQEHKKKKIDSKECVAFVQQNGPGKNIITQVRGENK